MQKNILITGRPAQGKSTLLRKIIEDIPNRVGFVTNEIRENDKRVGFEMETNNGNKVVLARNDYLDKIPVGNFFVDPERIELILPDVSEFSDHDLLYLDEVGEMQLFSKRFKDLLIKYLDSSNISLMTISSIFQDDFLDSIKNRDDIILLEINENNRDELVPFIKKLIKKINKAKKYVAEKERFEISETGITLNSKHGVRNLTKDGSRCDCDWFKEHGLCSHSIATEEILRQG